MTRLLAPVALLAVAGLALASAEPPATPAPQTAATPDLEPRTGLPTGTPAPDVTLWDDEKVPHQLGSLIAQAPGPVVVIFYRGGWCPFCTKHLAQVQGRLEDLKDLNATILAIAPEAPEKLGVAKDKSEAEFTLLSDAELRAAKAYNLVFDVDATTQKKYEGYGIDLATWNAGGEWKLPVPAVFIIDREGIIRWRHVDEDYTKRVDADDLVAAVESVVKG